MTRLNRTAWLNAPRAGASIAASAALLTLAALAGCDRDPAADGAGVAPAASVVLPPSTVPATGPGGVIAGYVAGIVTTADGRPVAGADIFVAGRSRSGHPAAVSLKTDAAGRYAQPVAPGTYNAWAQLSRTIDGRAYLFDPEPADRDAAARESTADASAGQGVVRNFVWRIAGARSPQPLPPTTEFARPEWFSPARKAIDESGSTVRDLAPDRPKSYHGGSLVLREGDPNSSAFPFLSRSDTGNDVKAIKLFPEVATIEVTLQPAGPLLDGSEGKALTRSWKITQGRLATILWAERQWLDIPLGNYRATATIAEAGKPARPLRVAFAQADVASGPTRSEVIYVHKTLLAPAVSVFFPPLTAGVSKEPLPYTAGMELFVMP